MSTPTFFSVPALLGFVLLGAQLLLPQTVLAQQDGVAADTPAEPVVQSPVAVPLVPQQSDGGSVQAPDGSGEGGSLRSRGAGRRQGDNGGPGSGRRGGGRRGEAAAATTAAAATADENTVQQLVMRDQGLPDVLNYLELLTKKAILRSQTLPAVKITFDSVGPMSREEAIMAIESLLSLNGVAVTPVGERFIKAVQIGEVAKQVPQFLSGSAMALPPSQQFYTKYFKLNYLDALNEGQPIVLGLLSVAAKQEGNPVIFPKSNSIMVTDMLINLQRMEEVLGRADQPNELASQLHFFRLKHVKASELKTRLTTLINSKDSVIGASFSHNTAIEADERTNQLIVVTHQSNLPLLTQLIDGLDSDVEPQTNSEVYYIKHAEAVDIQALLQAVVNGQQQAREQANSSQNAANSGAGAVPTPPPGTPAEVVAAISASASGGLTAVISDSKNLQFSDYVTVVADERANAIVAYGTHTDLKQIGELIDKIDILLAQVNIQVIIAEVTLEEGFTNGIEQLSVGYGADGLVAGGLPGWSTSISGNSQTPVGQPFSFTGTLDPRQFQFILGNARKNSNFRMLSSPLIVTTHNKEGEVNVTESRPIITGTSTQLTDTPVTNNTVTQQDIGIKLKVTPLIGNNGIIQMKVEQRVENITGYVTVNGNEQPIVGKREALSYVSVNSGEVVVLAGLQESSLTERDNKLWLIGDIPLIGDLINGRSKVTSRRELMIFIQPFVMTTHQEIHDMAEQAIDNLDNGEDIRTFLRTRDMSDVTTEQAKHAEEGKRPPAAADTPNASVAPTPAATPAAVTGANVPAATAEAETPQAPVMIPAPSATDASATDATAADAADADTPPLRPASSLRARGPR